MTPQATYAERLARWRTERAAHQRSAGRLSGARLVVFLVGVGCFFYVTKVHPPAWPLLPLLLVLFAGLVALHARARHAAARAEAAVAFYERGESRLDGTWVGRGDGGERWLDALSDDGSAHLYAHDIDVFGKGSLYQLLGTARTPLGERCLARWLLGDLHPGRAAGPARGSDASAADAEAGTRAGPHAVDVELVRERQVAVAELSHDLDLREALAVAAPDVTVAFDPDALERWAGGEPSMNRPGELWCARVLGLAGALSFVCALMTWTTWLPFLGVVLIEYVFGRFTGPRLDRLTSEAAAVGGELVLFAELLSVFEQRSFGDADGDGDATTAPAGPHTAPPSPDSSSGDTLSAGSERAFTAPRLRALMATLSPDDVRPSLVVGRLGRHLGALQDAANNGFSLLVSMVLQSRVRRAYVLDALRRRVGHVMPAWLEAAGELEVLCALATHAFEHPSHVYPRVVEGAPRLEARGLGHVLLPEAVCVRNDLALGDGLSLLLVSGSNMSGKSTLLRAVGVNVVLALAGAPVRAEEFTLSPFRVGASIVLHDSLQEGASRFYAEIKRLRDIDRLTAGDEPVLFLLDEILAGTNSSDREVGAGAVVRHLLARGAVGIVTTHDLALARMADGLGAAARNVHFEDQLVDGEMVFDYRMRDGVVQRGNALPLMRSLGLDV